MSTMSSRSQVVSSFTIAKGSLIEETYTVFAAWDFAHSKKENLDRLRAENFIGSRSADPAPNRWTVSLRCLI